MNHDLLLHKHFMVDSREHGKYMAAKVIKQISLYHMPIIDSLLALKEGIFFYINNIIITEGEKRIDLIEYTYYKDWDFEQLEKEVYEYLDKKWTLDSIIERKPE